MHDNGERMLGGLIAAHHLATIEELPALVAEQARQAGFTHPVLYVADLQETFLVPLPGQRQPDGAPPERLRIDGTVAGRAFRTLDMVQTRHAEGLPGDESAQPPEDVGPRRVYLPLLDGTERLGVLALTLPSDDGTVRWNAAQLAGLLALILANKRSTSDTYARLVRSRPMQLSAEVLWTLLPIRTFATGRVVVSAALEPAYLVGGDAFDYAKTGDTLHLAIFDAMGHDTAAGLTATIAMGACRNSRRENAGLRATGEAIDAAIVEQFGGTQFATGVLAELDVTTGRLSWVNRGHPPPLVLRHGRLVATLETEPDPPMGFGMEALHPPAHYQLEPGDRLLFYTDGVIEARSPSGEEFGLERFADFVIRREADNVPPPETMRRLIQTLLEHQQDRLQDDATVLLVEWKTQRQLQLVL
ncbi:PP2C family protein-serine/threonine phosphatase [Nonomuraea muscovyensis]|uniref:PP2C family protein-serine/threonine phosphatase n=1 Tax=Nonomuraea muscovyensis TaxID=1124761 RepID=UPI00340D4B99|nr:serine/threonine protein phosphatase [Nonomuraea muscovyensis]